MADPLGLVFSGQDGTGAAFKAPWTSYDPYSAELKKGEVQLKMLEAKKEVDDKKKEDILKQAAYVAPNWSEDQAGSVVEFGNSQSKFLTDMLSNRDFEGAKQATIQMKAFNDAFKNNSNIQYQRFQQAQNRLNTTPNALKEEANINLKVFSDPSIATDADYPEVANAYRENLAKYQEIYANTRWVTPKMIEAVAKVATRDNILHLLDTPVNYEKRKWIIPMHAEAKKRMKENAQNVGKSVETYQVLTLPEAQEIATTNFINDVQLQNQMRREFRDLTEEELSEFGNPTNVKDYFVNRYAPELVIDNKGLKGGGSTFNLYAGGKQGEVAEGQIYESDALKVPVGKLDLNTNRTQTNVTMGSRTSIATPGGEGDILSITPGLYISIGNVDVDGTMNYKETTTPMDFRYQDSNYAPTILKDYSADIQDESGKIIGKMKLKANNVLTDESFEYIKKYNIKFPNDVLGWKPWALGARVYDSGGKKYEESVFIPFNKFKPLYYSWLSGKNIKTKPIDETMQKPKDTVYERFGIQTIKSGTTTTPAPTSGGATTPVKPKFN